MFSCFYTYSGSRSNMTSPRDRRGGRAPLSPSSRKKRQKTVWRPSPLPHLCCRSPRSLLLPLPPPAFPMGSRSILTFPLEYVEEEVRAPLPPSPRKMRKKERTAPLSLAPLFIHVVPHVPSILFLLLLPRLLPPHSPPPSARMRVLFCVPLLVDTRVLERRLKKTKKIIKNCYICSILKYPYLCSQ